MNSKDDGPLQFLDYLYRFKSGYLITDFYILENLDALHSKKRLLTVKRFLSLLKDFLFKIGVRGNLLTVKGLSF